MDVNRIGTAVAFWFWMAIVIGWAVIGAPLGASGAALAGALVGRLVVVAGVGLVSHRVAYGAWQPGIVSRRAPEPAE